MSETVPAWVGEFLNRRVVVEQHLFEAASGKRPLPDQATCRMLALKLGVPDDAPEAVIAERDAAIRRARIAEIRLAIHEARDDLVRADYIDSTARMQAEKDRISRRVEALKSELAELQNDQTKPVPG